MDIEMKGGEWLGAVRSWLQQHKLNGSRVTWGSAEELQPPMTVKDVEDVALHAAHAERKRVAKIVEERWNWGKEEILNQPRRVSRFGWLFSPTSPRSRWLPSSPRHLVPG